MARIVVILGLPARYQ